MAEPELTQDGSDPLWLLWVGRQWAPRGDVTELATAGADAAQDHDRERLPVPALADVRTRGAFADGVQPELVNALAKIEEDLACGHLHPNPGRMPRTGCRVGAGRLGR